MLINFDRYVLQILPDAGRVMAVRRHSHLYETPADRSSKFDTQVQFAN